jgi:UDP-N-acetyl-D-mannosaminuronic acid dehydrogenase
MDKNSYDVCIVGGLGHVGLPLGISFAQSGKKVVLYDTNEQSRDIVASGRLPFLESGAEEILKQVLDRTLFVSSDKSVISKSHYVIIAIGTPVDEHLNPKFTLFKKFFDGIIDLLDDGQHVVLRSTIFPGSTQKIKQYLESKGKKTGLSFCPERIAQGKAMEELRSLPQIVSAFDDASLNEARDLFSVLTEDIVFLTPIEAELGKLFTNAWRYILFSISNQFLQIANREGVDFYRIYNGITYNYPRAASFPPAGFAAGPCLFKDTMQLAAYSDNNFFLGHSAMLINEGLPNYIVQRLKEKYKVHEKTVGILGMAFKANNDDVRESLSFKLKKILEVEAGAVLCSDVYAQNEGFVSAERLVRESDIIILGTPHREYAGLVFDKEKVVVDIWNFYGKGSVF